MNVGLTQHRLTGARPVPQARPKVDRIYLAVLIMSFPGYPLVAAFTTPFDLPNVSLLSHTWLDPRCAYEIVLKETSFIFQEDSHNAI